jgi:hypothetical protein
MSCVVAVAYNPSKYKRKTTRNARIIKYSPLILLSVNHVFDPNPSPQLTESSSPLWLRQDVS